MPTEPAPKSTLRRALLIEPDEWRPAVWSAAYVFLLFTSYSIMRPVRESFGIERGADKLPSLITATLIAMLIATPIFGWLVSRFPRRRFIPLVYRFFALNILAFFAFLHVAPADLRVQAGYAFYVWLSVFNLFVVTVFWGLMADVWTSAQAKRLFGPIGVGATLGVIAGSSATAFLIEHIGPTQDSARANLLLLAAILLEAAVWCMLRVVRFFPRDLPSTGRSPARAFDGLKSVARSPYLLGISGYMLAYTICSTFLYLKVGDVVDASITDRAQRVAFYARIALVTNILTLATQLFLTAHLIRLVGIGVALTAVPLVTIGGFIALDHAPEWGIPALTAVFVFSVARSWTNYAVSRPSREMLYSVLSRDDKYKAKSFIDTFVYRSGDALGAWGPKWLAAAGASLAAGAVIIGACGLVLGLVLGSMRRKRAQSSSASESPPSATAPPSEPHQ